MAGDDGQQRAEEVSQRCYHAYRLQKNPSEQPLLLWGGNLSQQYVMDAWASVEQNELNWVRYHQKYLRAEVCSGHDNMNLAEHSCHGYPQYARPKNGHSVTKYGHVYDNRDAVPYNPYLCAK